MSLNLAISLLGIYLWEMIKVICKDLVLNAFVLELLIIANMMKLFQKQGLNGKQKDNLYVDILCSH